MKKTVRVIGQAKAQRALSRMRQQASRRGIAKTSPPIIRAEIGAVRRERKQA